MLTKCRICGLSKPKHKAERGPRQGWRYRDHLGAMWLGKMCPDCNRRKAIATGRAAGHRPIDEVTEPTNQKGRQSERIAAEWFKRCGFSVVMTTTGKGPDLQIEKNGVSHTVEVKSVISRKRKTSTDYKVKSVSDARQKDDLIAYVWPNKIVSVTTMPEHLARCWADGDCGL